MGKLLLNFHLSGIEGPLLSQVAGWGSVLPLPATCIEKGHSQSCQTTAFAFIVKLRTSKRQRPHYLDVKDKMIGAHYLLVKVNISGTYYLLIKSSKTHFHFQSCDYNYFSTISRFDFNLTDGITNLLYQNINS